jgi:hypothetical protein
MGYSRRNYFFFLAAFFFAIRDHLIILGCELGYKVILFVIGRLKAYISVIILFMLLLMMKPPQENTKNRGIRINS